jgi:hypothetical protein
MPVGREPYRPLDTVYKFALEDIPARRRAAARRICDNINVAGETVYCRPVETVQLSQPSFASAAHDRAANSPGGRHAEPSFLPLSRHQKQHEMLPGHPDTVPVDPLKISPPFEPKGCWKTAAPLRRQAACAPCGGAH